MKDFLVDEQKFYDAHKAELVQKYLGKQIVIYQDDVAGVFDRFLDAANFTKENNFVPGKFMIKQVTRKEPVYEVIPSLVQIEGDSE